MSSVFRIVSSILGEIRSVIEKDGQRDDELWCGLSSLKLEMEAVPGLLRDVQCQGGGALQETRIRQLQELVHDVEDFLEGLRNPGHYGKVLVAMGTDPRAGQIARINHFTDKISFLIQECKKSPGASHDDDPHDEGEDTEEEEEEEDPSHPRPRGVDNGAKKEEEELQVHKAKIVELLSPAEGEQQQWLRVVSIVGCRGVGKTALARAVQAYYCRSAPAEFDCVAWVPASRCNNKTLQDKIIQRIRLALPSPAAKSVPSADEARPDYSVATLQDLLSSNRCLVFIDDVRKSDVCQDTIDTCKEYRCGSRIIVTTSFRSVAIACSSGSYLYSMKCLCRTDSESLFWRKVKGHDQSKPEPSLATESEEIFKNCGGLPLALDSAARYLNEKRDRLNSSHCEHLGKYLFSYYLSDKNNVVAFKRLRRRLKQCYNNLPDYDHRVFLLYLSIFPRGHQIKSKSLDRRLTAEGFVVNEGSGICLDQLIDRCIVEPVQISNNSVVVNSYQVHDVVLGYIIQKSLDKNFVTVIEGCEPPRLGSSCARRLSIQYSSEGRFDELEDRIEALRSLTMIKSAPFDIQRCKLLRLLDLEGCTKLKKEFLDGLCELLLLRYLSLRDTLIDHLPAEIEKLHRLETLDIRGTQVENLPIKVIMLPKLAYLFGKFQLSGVSNDEARNRLREFLETKSVLHTISGYIASKRYGPEHVILYARKVKKVKVLCFAAPVNAGTSFRVLEKGSSSSVDEVPVGCENSLELNPPGKNAGEGTQSDYYYDFISLLKSRYTSPGGLESVCIMTNLGLCNDFMVSLEGPCTIKSIKLHGSLDSLPDSDRLGGLGRIKKLQLCLTGLNAKDLSALQQLRGLEYLKFEDPTFRVLCKGTFIVEESGFESLKSLCMESPMVPNLRFEQGAMASLTSLQLLCKSSWREPSETVKGIQHLAKLSEVILRCCLPKSWDRIADGHPNRPCVRRQA